MKQKIRLRERFRMQNADALTLVFLLLLPLVFFWRETLGWLTLGEADVVFWFYPIWNLAAEQIKAGQLPLWNPNLYGGTPLFASWQPGLLDPLNWLHILGPTSRTLTISQEISFAIALLGTFGFMRLLGIMRRASVVSAVIYALSGYTVARTIYPGLLHIFVLMPLVLYFVERLYQAGRWRDCVIGGLIVAWQIFAAHPQPFIYSSLLAAAYAMFCVAFRPDRKYDDQSGIESEMATAQRGGSSRLRFLAQCTTMFVIGLALTSVQLMPAWEVASQSVRQRVPFEFFTWHSLHPATLLTTLFPFFHGQGRGIYHLPYWGSYWHHNEAQIYLGVLAIALAVTGVSLLWREQSRQVAFWSITALIAIALSLGKYVGPLAWLFYRVPLLNQFRSPNRHWMEVTMAVAVLAGYAVDRLLRGEAKAAAQVAQIAAGVLTLLCVVVGAAVVWRRDRVESFIRALPDMDFLSQGFLQQAGAEFYFPVISACCLFAVIIVFARTTRRARWYPLLLAALLLDFNLYATFAPISNPFKLEAFIGRSMPAELAAAQSRSEPTRYHLMLSPMEGSFNPYWFHGHEMATGYDPLMNVRYLTFSGINEAGRSTLPTMLDERDRTLDLLNVRYVLVPAPLLNIPTVQGERVEYGGITFANDPSSRVELRPGQRANFSAGAEVYDTLAIVSTLTNSAELADGDEVAEIMVECESGERTVTMLRAGRDTAEWAYDRSDVRALVHHSRAPLAASWPGNPAGSFQAHSYLARLPLPANVAGCGTTRFVKITSKARDSITVDIKHLSLHNSASGHSTPLMTTFSGSLRDTARWREMPIRGTGFGYPDLRVYENLRSLPRIWVVSHAEPRNEYEQLQLIRGEALEGQERLFNPLEVALIDIDPADVNKVDPALLEHPKNMSSTTKVENVNGVANVVKREPARMHISSSVARPSLLVMSEIYFPGWRAKVDGGDVEILRVNYLLRGIELSPGSHTVEVFYWPPSLTIGALVSAATLLLLLMLVIWRRCPVLRGKI